MRQGRTPPLHFSFETTPLETQGGTWSHPAPSASPAALDQQRPVPFDSSPRTPPRDPRDPCVTPTPQSLPFLHSIVLGHLEECSHLYLGGRFVWRRERLRGECSRLTETGLVQNLWEWARWWWWGSWLGAVSSDMGQPSPEEKNYVFLQPVRGLTKSKVV